MAVANVATLLAQAGRSVLVIDFDFEAPGLHRYFATTTAESLEGSRPGMIELLHRLRAELEQGTAPAAPAEAGMAAPVAARRRREAEMTRAAAVIQRLLDAEDYTHRATLKNPNGTTEVQVALITAGRFDDGYPERVRSFDWTGLYGAHPHAFRLLAEELARRYEFVLIDSRTGITDIGSVCTVLLPEKLVLVFAPNEQSLNGAIEIGRQAVEARKKSADMRPLPIFPLVSRVENAEEDLQKQWIADAKTRFEKLFGDVYGLGECDLTWYFDALRIPHKSKYAYGERIAAEEQRTLEDGSLAAAFQQLATALGCNNVLDARAGLVARFVQPSHAQTAAVAAEERARQAQAMIAKQQAELEELREHRLAALEKNPAVPRYVWLAIAASVAVGAIATRFFTQSQVDITPPITPTDPLKACLAENFGASDVSIFDIARELEAESVQRIPPLLGGAIYELSLDPGLAAKLESCRIKAFVEPRALGFRVPVRVLDAEKPVAGATVAWTEGSPTCVTDALGQCFLNIRQAPLQETSVTVKPPAAPLATLPVKEVKGSGPVLLTLPSTSKGGVLDARSTYYARAIVNAIETHDAELNWFLGALRVRPLKEFAKKDAFYFLMQDYVAAQARYSNDVRAFLLRMEKGSVEKGGGEKGTGQKGVGETTNEKSDRGLLLRVANDPVMIKLSDTRFGDRFWNPALKRAGELGLKTPLSASVLCDTLLASSGALEDAISATNKAISGPPTTGVDEREWLTKFLQLSKVPTASIYLKLAAEGNWDLHDPVRVRDVLIPPPPIPLAPGAPAPG
jgi:hypothetical protein